MTNTLGTFLRKRRLELGMTTRQVAEKAGVSRAYISLLERDGKGNPSKNVLKALAKGYELPEAELYKVALDLDTEPERITHEKLARIGFAYRGMPARKQQKLDALIDLVDREMLRLKDEDED